MPQQQRDISEGTHEGKQPTEDAAEITGGIAIEVPIVSIATTAAGQHGPNFTERQGTSES